MEQRKKNAFNACLLESAIFKYEHSLEEPEEILEKLKEDVKQ